MRYRSKVRKIMAKNEKPIEKYKLNNECKRCKRLTYNGGECGGRKGIKNNCLLFIDRFKS